MSLATPTRRMPTPEAVRDFFSDLLGKGVSVDRRPEVELDDGAHSWISGVFVEDDGSVGGACVADLSLASYAGAALAMVPKPIAEESITAGELAEGLTENFHEVANILTALLNGASVPHLKISALEPGVPDEVRDLVVRAAGRRTYEMHISDYGSGLLTLYAR